MSMAAKAIDGLVNPAGSFSGAARRSGGIDQHRWGIISGHRLAAFVVPRPGSRIGESAVREYLKDKVSRFEQRRDVRIVTSIPRNPAGKVLRHQLPT